MKGGQSGIKKIKNYRLVREAGRGANGVIYESIDENTQKQYAIKAIPADKISEKQILESFKNELRALHKIDHENIIKLYGVEKTANNIYLILEYANGGNLQQYLNYYLKKNKNQLPVPVVQFFIRNIIKGLEYMHQNNIIHRDLKLDNILLNFKNVEKVDYDTINIFDASVLVADLGYAKILKNSYDETQSICGTPIIMAPDMINLRYNPEVRSNDLTYNYKVDLWSLGAITYQLLFGFPPFLARNINELFKEIIKGKYSISKNVKISIETVTFINGLLQYYPDKRFEWHSLNSHPFILNSVESFHMLELDQIDGDKLKEKIEIDSKNSDNLLWVMFKPKKKNVNLDSISLDNLANNSTSTGINNKEDKNNIKTINNINANLEVNETMVERNFDTNSSIKPKNGQNSKTDNTNTNTNSSNSNNPIKPHDEEAKNGTNNTEEEEKTLTDNNKIIIEEVDFNCISIYNLYNKLIEKLGNEEENKKENIKKDSLNLDFRKLFI